MAGIYPDVPGPRMAYDVDGSAVLFIDASSAITQLNASDMQLLNDTDGSAAGENIANPFNGYVAFLFPQLRDINGYFISDNSASVGQVSTSTDTTNGVNGTWVQRAATGVAANAIIPNYRTSIQTLSAAGVKAIRFKDTMSNNAAYHAIHLYGTISSSQVYDRVLLWHPTLDQPLSSTPAILDFAETTRGSSDVRTFRVKNVSTTLTAAQVVVDVTFPTDASPSLLGQYTLTYGGSAYSSSVQVGTIGPNSISGVVTVRRDTNLLAQLGLGEFRLSATAGSMT